MLASLLACSTDPGDDPAAEPDALTVQGEVESETAALDDKADRPDLALRVVNFTPPASVGRSETRRVLTTARAFRAFMGVAPTGIDFSREWVVYYSAGLKPTGGHAASVTRVRSTDSGLTLKVTTRLDSPGPACVVTQATSKPQVLVAFARPRPAPSYVSYSTANTTRSCTSSSCGPTPVASDLGRLDLTVRGRVRAVYFTPSDRPLRACLGERLETWLGLARDFYRDEMRAAGFVTAAGAGKTFSADVDAAGRWRVAYMIGEHDAAWYRAQVDAAGNPDAPGAAMAEMFRRLPAAFHNDNVTVYFYDTTTVAEQRVHNSGNAGSGAPWEGAGAGYVLQGTHFMGFGLGFDTVATSAAGQRALFEDRTPSGVQDWDVNGVWRELTRGEYASSMVGASIHELGHAFYLDHVFDLTGGLDLNIMGNGFRRFGGRFTPAGPQPATILGPTSAAALDAALLFN
ncbi:MAG: protease complex subunit PrcB family protein [Deltaproteobacteria bacterium]|nr:protease complex subunit PrcB family protein [Deltaproteobacteria bacterium]